MKIDNQFHIETDNMGCTLVRVQDKTRESKETKEQESYQTTERWYFLNIEQCLNRYLDLAIEPAKSAAEVLSAIKEARLFIKTAVKSDFKPLIEK